MTISKAENTRREAIEREARLFATDTARRRLILQYRWEDGTEYYVYQSARPFPVKRAVTGHWFFQHPATDYTPDAVIPWHRFTKATARVLADAREQGLL